MIKQNQEFETEIKYLTFNDAAKILGSGTGNRVRNFVKQGKITAYKLPLVQGLRVRNVDVLSLITVNLAKNEEIN